VSARGQRLRVLAAIPALVAIFFLGQGLLDRGGWRLDLTAERRYTLSDHARRVLGSLEQDVRILGFLRSQDPRNVGIRDLVRQFALATPRVRVEVVDVNRSPSLAREYAVASTGAVVVEAEGRRRVVTSPREETLVGAILQVTRRERRAVGWVLGHGEGDPGSIERRTGYSTVRRALENQYYDVVPLSLVGADVPVGTSVLAIVGPTRDFLPEELDALGRYLDRGGRLLVMLDPHQAPALARFFEDYHLRIGSDVVVDPKSRLYGGEYLTMQLAFDRGTHPVLAPLAAAPLFSRTRSIEVLTADGADVRGFVFLRTGEESWTTTDPDATRVAVPLFVAGRDRRGPIGVAADLALRMPTPPGAEPREARIVAYGNAQFANNFFVELLGNKDLFVNTVAWLARDSEGIGHRTPQQLPGVNQFFVSEEDGARLFWASAVLLPGVFAALGVALTLRRRWST
jgi:ABC-type uncharacterized transport system involved in gliding motility auxiliary subunit